MESTKTAKVVRSISLSPALNQYLERLANTHKRTVSDTLYQILVDYLENHVDKKIS